MIKLTISKFGDMHFAEPQTAYVWLNVKEIGSDAINVLPTVHKSINEAKEQMEKNTNTQLAIVSQLPPKEFKIESKEIFEADNFREAYHAKVKEIFEESKLYDKVEVVL